MCAFPHAVAFVPSVLQVLAKHLFREGRFESGHALLQEAGMQGDAKGLAAPFQAMHEVLVQVSLGVILAAMLCALHTLCRQSMKRVA